MNAVRTQLWIALCAYLLVAFIKFRSRLGQSILQILRLVQLSYSEKTFYAFDISKDFVQITAKSEPNWAVNWFVGDLARLPIKDASMDVLLDIFSPANYGEFRRVLSKDGVLIKDRKAHV